MPILIILLAVVFLLTLIIRFKFHPFIALTIVAVFTGLAQGMDFSSVLKSMQNGVGGTLGYLAFVLGFGAMLGAIIAQSGAAEQITDRLVRLFGKKHIQWALVLTGFIVGIPMFYTVGFIMLVPLVFVVARTTGLPLLYLAIPLVASLSVTHGFLPPHPAPTAIALIYEADLGLTLVYGLIIAVPTIIIAGPLFGRTLKHINVTPNPAIMPIPRSKDLPMPSFAVSLWTALLPVILMAGAAVAKLVLAEDSFAYQLINFIGEPIMALLIALLVATYTLGLSLGQTMKSITTTYSESVKGIAMIMLIIGGGGAFKQVLIDSGISEFIVSQLQNTNLNALILAWAIAAALRIALGSATVAAITAGGIAAPLIGSGQVNPELLVLATGAGSLTFSQVNDTGFWLFKEYFNLTIWETFRSWTVMETLVSIIGLIGCLLLDLFI